MLPDYFFEVAASSTGKYHPLYATGNGGLVRHTKAAVAFAHGLLQLEQYQNKFSLVHQDLIITALILHDGIKHGLPKGNFTSADHPLVVADYIKNLFSAEFNPEWMEILYGNIASHMGQWNTDFKSKKEILPKPRTESQEFVHMCDYLASRKWLNVDFGDNYFDPSKYNDESALKSKISEIIAFCKEEVARGRDREEMYKIIADNNGGNRNPNSIQNLETAVLIEKYLKGE